MGKLLAGALAGVFVGAVLMEVLRKTKPGLIESAEDKVCDTAKGLGRAFKEGYRKAAPEGEPEAAPA